MPRRDVRARAERFGAILATDEPPMLAWVDQDFARSVGVPESPLWSEPPREVLSAPTEVHMLATRRCPLTCDHCYTDSSPEAGTDLDTAAFKARLGALAELGVFHVALGGGEAFLRPDLLELAAHARAVGLTPNVTTSGFGLERFPAAEVAALFGQINLSVDRVRDDEPDLFGEDKTARARRVLDPLVAAGARVGFNVVLTRDNFAELGEIARFGVERGITDIEVLRFKPTGRGRDGYLARRLTPEQRLRLFPMVLEVSEATGLPIKLDCSSTPFVACHQPDPERMARFDVVGCIGGVTLLGADEQGRASACSFYPPESGDLLDPVGLWENPESFREFRDYPTAAREPCRSCPYLGLCRGGCRAVARFLTGDPLAPDPECPAVRAANELEV